MVVVKVEGKRFGISEKNREIVIRRKTKDRTLRKKDEDKIQERGKQKDKTAA